MLNLLPSTLLTLLYTAVCSAQSTPQSSCRTESQPNIIANHYFSNITGGLNGTIAIHPIQLSLQISRCDSLSDAMSLFTMQEELKGSNKYRCEKCKQLVNARKQFTVEECPNVLTVHLKRFHATGAKISRSIAYPEKFRMRKEWMSDGAEGYTYHLYAIVYHFGSSPNSGHYIADVKGPNGKWTRTSHRTIT